MGPTNVHWTKGSNAKISGELAITDDPGHNTRHHRLLCKIRVSGSNNSPTSDGGKWLAVVIPGRKKIVNLSLDTEQSVTKQQLSLECTIPFVYIHEESVLVDQAGSASKKICSGLSDASHVRGPVVLRGLPDPEGATFCKRGRALKTKNLGMLYGWRLHYNWH